MVNQEYAPGSYHLQWPGTDQNNTALPSGIYFCKIQARNFTATRKIMLLR
ncbi:T9SS type A sorting domain-containing protein [candidate division KSB1 bacterium]|nr:T9SS type A sorting domain-containing protein [candidate division KSB1 bacterium]